MLLDILFEIPIRRVLEPHLEMTDVEQC